MQCPQRERCCVVLPSGSNIATCIYLPRCIGQYGISKRMCAMYVFLHMLCYARTNNKLMKLVYATPTTLLMRVAFFCHQLTCPLITSKGQVVNTLLNGNTDALVVVMMYHYGRQQHHYCRYPKAYYGESVSHCWVQCYILSSAKLSFKTCNLVAL